MFKVDRDEANDRVWVTKARACISCRSEPLWEKLKNSLGVPPELELSNDESSDEEDLEAAMDSMVGLDVPWKDSISTDHRHRTYRTSIRSRICSEHGLMAENKKPIHPQGQGPKFWIQARWHRYHTSMGS